MSEYIGATGAWQLHCTLSLASCRLRAETLARRLHSKLWAPGCRYDHGGANAVEGGFYERCEVDPAELLVVEEQEEIAGGCPVAATAGAAPPFRTNRGFKSKYGVNAGFVNVGNYWKDTATGTMFATAMANSSSLDDEEFYDPEGHFSSPPSPAEDQEIIVNAPVSAMAKPGGFPSDKILPEEMGEQTKMLRTTKRNGGSKMVTNNEELYEKLAQIADSLNMSTNSSCADDDDVRRLHRKSLDECDSGISSNGALFNVVPVTRDEPVVVREPKPVNGELFDELEVDLPEDELETPRAGDEEEEATVAAAAAILVRKEGDEPKETTTTVLTVGKFSVTPVLSQTQDTPEVRVETLDEPLRSISPVEQASFKSSLSIDSVVSISLDLKSVDLKTDEDDDEYEFDRKVLLRSTSLKSGKTPPGTPRRKKIVRFADALGLDLEAVRHIVSDDLPVVPASAFNDLRIGGGGGFDFNNPVIPSSSNQVQVPRDSRALYPQFSQPVTDPYFLDRVRNQRVCLENIVISNLSLFGVVRVLNVSFEKSVLVRYTNDDWVNCYETKAEYIAGSNDGFSDRFRFTLSQSGLCPGQKVTFAIRYLTEGREHWDNNYGVNYTLKCDLPATVAPPTSEHAESPTWMFAYM